MTVNVVKSIGAGLTPQAFVQGMTRNQDKFQHWYNEFSWADASDQAFFASLRNKRLHCIIIAADWCGDVVRNVPVVFRVLEEAQIPTDVLIMEEHLDVMDQFLTMGGRSIPVVLFVSQSGEVLGKWGPRPQYVQEVMVKFKQENTDKDAPDYESNLRAAREEMMRRYGDDTAYQQWIVKELRALLTSLK